MSRPRPTLKRSESLHQQVATNLRNDIAAGVLRDGQRLPSTRELADEWGVSVFTITEAMNLLIEEGLVESKPRAGRIVRAPGQPDRPQVRTANPQVLLIGGYAGSGKTELGRILSRETGWPMFDKDTLTRPIVEAALELLGQSPHDRESETYLQVIRPREYESLINATTENVQCGNSAVVTAPFVAEFSDLSWLHRIKAQVESLNAELHLVWVHCDADTMHTYIRHRGAARDAAKLADWPAWLTKINVDFQPVLPYAVIDNSASSRPLQAQAKELVASLASEES